MDYPRSEERGENIAPTFKSGMMGTGLGFSH
jgi:hypothetical protein